MKQTLERKLFRITKLKGKLIWAEKRFFGGRIECYNFYVRYHEIVKFKDFRPPLLPPTRANLRIRDEYAFIFTVIFKNLRHSRRNERERERERSRGVKKRERTKIKYKWNIRDLFLARGGKKYQNLLCDIKYLSQLKGKKLDESETGKWVQKIKEKSEKNYGRV